MQSWRLIPSIARQFRGVCCNSLASESAFPYRDGLGGLRRSTGSEVHSSEDKAPAPEYQNIRVDVADGVGTITISRPKQLNALNSAVGTS